MVDHLPSRYIEGRWSSMEKQAQQRTNLLQASWMFSSCERLSSARLGARAPDRQAHLANHRFYSDAACIALSAPHPLRRGWVSPNERPTWTVIVNSKTTASPTKAKKQLVVEESQ